MKTFPEFNACGDLPPGIHGATLEDVLHRFGTTARRTVIVRRLQRIYQLARSTGHLAHFIIFGSFITAKSEPNDIDIFLGENYRMSAAGFLAEIDRMNLEIRDYLWSLPAEHPASAA